MVKEKTIKSIRYYQCEVCDMYYKDKDLAEKCEIHCREKNACNIEIIKHAVKIENV
jgi:hypothetical protein